MAEGTVKFFNDEKGYGFIAPEGGSQDVFVHVTELRRSGIESLEEGQRVSFEVKIDPKRGKPNAVDVRVLGAPVSASRRR
jgi:CspA family cold shock protein